MHTLLWEDKKYASTPLNVLWKRLTQYDWVSEHEDIFCIFDMVYIMILLYAKKLFCCDALVTDIPAHRKALWYQPKLTDIFLVEKSRGIAWKIWINVLRKYLGEMLFIGSILTPNSDAFDST